MYTLWLPFQLAPNIDFSDPDQPFECRLDGYPTTLFRKNQKWLLQVTDLSSEAAAQELLNRLAAALQWASVTKRLGIHLEAKAQAMEFFGDPDRAGREYATKFGNDEIGPIDGYVSSRAPAIFPTGKRILSSYANEITAIQRPHLNDVVADLQEGLGISALDRVFHDPKIKLAIETLRLSRHVVRSEEKHAKFLAMMNVLEVLKPRRRRPQELVSLVERWESDLAVIQSEPSELRSLKGSLSYLKEQSIKRRIRSLVSEALKNDGHSDAEEKGKLAGDLYNIRSDLVHDGKTDKQIRFHELEDIVQRTLLSVMRNGLVQEEVG